MKTKEPIVLHASSMHRFMRCPGAYWLENEHGIDEAGAYAEEGTRQHKLCEDVLYGLESEETLPREDWDLIKDYIDVVRSKAKGAQAFFVEKTSMSKLSEKNDSIFLSGTPDAVIIKDNVLQIHDRKLPFGAPVEPEGNEQLLTYALFYEPSLFDRVEFYIHQGKDCKDHTVTLAEVTEFTRKLLALVEQLDRVYRERTPSETACRYCTAKHVCPELKALVEKSVQPFPDDISEKEQNQNQSVVAVVRMWCDAVEKHTYRMLMNGKKLENWKLVQSFAGPRKWIDEESAEQSMQYKCGLNNAQIYERKLISPTQCEKQFPDQYKLLEEDCVIERTPGAPTVVKRTDKRPELDRSIEFEDLTKKA